MPLFSKQRSNLMLSAGVSLTVLMSAAIPFVCWLFTAPPTAALSFGHRYPLVTIIGIPHFVLNGSYTFSTSAVILARTAASASLSMPSRLAVALFVNSLNVKYFIVFHPPFKSGGSRPPPHH